MMQICIRSNEMGEDKKTYSLFIDAQDGSVGLTVFRDKENLQIDFNLEKEDWEDLKTYIDNKLKPKEIVKLNEAKQ